MDKPVVTAAPPPPKVKTLAQEETDFTSEGSPPPGAVGPVASLPSVDEASDSAHWDSKRKDAEGKPTVRGHRHTAGLASTRRHR